jgi:two-component system, NtrC family, sensor histidine kinase HydH
MNAWAWAYLLSAAAALTVAALAVTRATQSPLGLPLALLGADQFLFNAASLGQTVTGSAGYAWLGQVAAPLFAPLAFHFVVAFVGQRARWHRWIQTLYLVFGLQSALAALAWCGLVLPGGLPAYAGLFMVSGVPTAGLGLALVFRHGKAAGAPSERVRSHILFGSLTVAVVLMLTDLAAEVGWPLPRLAFFGSLLLSGALTALTLGLGLVAVRRRVAVAEAVALALFAATTYWVLFAAFRDAGGLFITAATGITLAAGAAARLAWLSGEKHREGLERFATLGRFSGQMAHDLKNPLAAAKGAAQYLETELATRGLKDTGEFAGLVVQQLDRVTAVIDRYQRLSAFEPVTAVVDFDEAVDQVLRLQAFAGGNGVSIRRTGGGAGVVRLDRDLFASALENVVKNAFEALPSGGGMVTVHTRRDGQTVSAVVTDTGQGMDARAIEAAFTLFITTKASGSGLGLPFVKQVLEAHGGTVRLSSTQGQGTAVTLSLPVEV